MSSAISSSTTPSTTSSSGSGAGSAVITSTGIGSGLDISAIVTSLTNAYGAAQTNQLNSQQTSLNAQVSAYGTFSSALDTLQAALTTLEDPSQLAGFDPGMLGRSITISRIPGEGPRDAHSAENIEHAAPA